MTETMNDETRGPYRESDGSGTRLGKHTGFQASASTDLPKKQTAPAFPGTVNAFWSFMPALICFGDATPERIYNGCSTDIPVRKRCRHGW